MPTCRGNMVFCKKFVSVILSSLLIFSHAVVADQVANYDTGKARIKNIMTHQETGIAAYNQKNVKFAQTQNLANDLNIEAIAKFFGCKTFIGQSYFEQTLQYPVLSEDKNTVLANRQNAIRALVENPALKQ